MFFQAATLLMKILRGKSVVVLELCFYIVIFFRIAPNLLHRVADIEHLVIVIATVFDVNR